MPYALKGLMLRPDRWSTLELIMKTDRVSEILSLSSSPAINLKKLRLGLSSDCRTVLSGIPLHDLFSSSPMREANLQRKTYLLMPINMAELHKFSAYSYEPGRMLFILQQAQNLTEFIITPAQLSVHVFEPFAYARITHTSLQRLSLCITSSNCSKGVVKVPVTFDYVTLPALRQFDILGEEFMGHDFEPDEYSRLVDLFHRSKCNLIIITFSLPVFANALLVPLLELSPALEKLDVAVNASVARDVFNVLTLERGMARRLKELSIRETPFHTVKCGILECVNELHEMILSRLVGDSRLETLCLALNTPWVNHPLPLPLPIAQDSPLRDLFKMKDKGLGVKILLDGKDCRMNEKARVGFFG
ncbi:uncharacterized protein ARMOST_20505 [Armillaria ostoyae]|uniref:F-box domain-containing protein n=1 Tax=Armillaria ostoyae TaxID=47428 RepID=A0A284S7I5_ARMOS|nr:uncharacterized protein ARMOST_20505 [Armillaria ostoyae]